MSIGQRVKAFREKVSMTQQDLACAARISLSLLAHHATRIRYDSGRWQQLVRQEATIGRYQNPELPWSR